ILRDGARGLVAVHAWHHDVHEDQVGLEVLGQPHPFAAITGDGRLEAALLERLLHDVHLGGGVIDDEDQGHADYLPPICASIAPSSSSFVKGLVRYCSEPTMRPRARSNRPSLEDSMITGISRNTLLFLISAQVW